MSRKSVHYNGREIGAAHSFRDMVTLCENLRLSLDAVAAIDVTGSAYHVHLRLSEKATA